MGKSENPSFLGGRSREENNMIQRLHERFNMIQYISKDPDALP